jgi:hypothetical protein
VGFPENPMTTLRFISAALGACLFTAVALAGDPTGTWKWTMITPNGDIESTAKLELKDGQLTGTYSNSYGDSTISAGTFQDDAIAFSVERDFGGNKFVLKYAGKLDGDTIKGKINAPGFDGAAARTLDWNAKREAAPKA